MQFYHSEYSKVSAKLKQNLPVELICCKIFFIQLFSRMTFNGCSRQQKIIVNVIKVIESVINEFERKKNLTGGNLLTDTGFARFL